MKKINLHLFKSIKLLYVGDDLMTQEEVSFFLQKYLGELYLAKNGEEAINIFLENKVDMIITDIQMPKVNGLEMSKRILEVSPKIPIIITTAYNGCEYLDQAMDLGVDKYISKPFNLETLLTMIEKSLPLEHELEK